MSPAAITPAATPPKVPPIMAGVRILLAETVFDELVGEPGAAVMTIMLTTVEACPAEVEVMEVRV